MHLRQNVPLIFFSNGFDEAYHKANFVKITDYKFVTTHFFETINKPLKAKFYFKIS